MGNNQFLNFTGNIRDTLKGWWEAKPMFAQQNNGINLVSEVFFIANSLLCDTTKDFSEDNAGEYSSSFICYRKPNWSLGQVQFADWPPGVRDVMGQPIRGRDSGHPGSDASQSDRSDLCHHQQHQERSGDRTTGHGTHQVCSNFMVCLWCHKMLGQLVFGLPYQIRML